MKYALLLLAVALQLSSAGQVYVRGRILDVATQQPLDMVVVSSNRNKDIDISNAEGLWQLTFSDYGKEAVRFQFSLVGYERLDTLISANKLTKPIQIRMRSLRNQLPLVVIKPAVPDTVFASERWNVADFSFVDNGMYLLVYDVEERWKTQWESLKTLFSDAYVIHIDSTGKEISAVPVPESVEGFYEDFLNEVFIIGRNNYYHVQNSNGLFLTEYSSIEFDDNIRPVLDTTGSKVLLSSYDPTFPMFQYRIYDKETKQSELISEIKDPIGYELMRSEFKYLCPRERVYAMNMELKTGIDKEIHAAYLRQFHLSPYFRPLYAPLVKAKDNWLIFNHHYNQIMKLDRDGNILSMTPIAYHRTKRPVKWERKVVYDKGMDKCYTIVSVDDNPSVLEVNLENGLLVNEKSLYFRYVEKVKILNGEIYYVYRPFESSQNRFLYKESIFGAP